MTDTTPAGLARRDEVAAAVFGAWIIAGLYLDGWAHNAEKPETFFTPWHLVLYAGIGAAIAWFSVEDSRRRARGITTEVPPALRWAAILVVSGGVGDMLWHEAFGIEDDLAALLSPTHLLLMTGGLLLLTTPLRSMAGRRAGAGSAREFAPAIVALSCALAIVAFFLQFGTPFKIEDPWVYAPGSPYDVQIRGVLGLIVTNGLLLGGVAWVLRNWARPPAGTFTFVFTALAFLGASQQGFDEGWLVLPAMIGGVAADLAVALGRRPVVVLSAAPLVTWLAWFATYHAVWGLGWEAEIWTGSVFFAVLTGIGFAVLGGTPNLVEKAPPGAPKEAKLAG